MYRISLPCGRATLLSIRHPNNDSFSSYSPDLHVLDAPESLIKRCSNLRAGVDRIGVFPPLPIFLCFQPMK